jgi:cytochrome c-type biogenesis protein CcmE
MHKRHKRLAFAAVAIGGLAVSAWLALGALNKNLVFFFTPSQIAAKEAPVHKMFRLGGLVEQGSLQRDATGLTYRFTVTDTANSIAVAYEGILPDLFKEGRGCVAEGTLGDDGVFHASRVLAKHDENYKPAELSQSYGS